MDIKETSEWFESVDKELYKFIKQHMNQINLEPIDVGLLKLTLDTAGEEVTPREFAVGLITASIMKMIALETLRGIDEKTKRTMLSEN